MKTVRYFLRKESRFLIKDDGEKISIQHFDTPTFVDLLEPITEWSCKVVRVRLFFPNGDIHEGRVTGYCVGLHNRDALFDGRFNSTEKP